MADEKMGRTRRPACAECGGDGLSKVGGFPECPVCGGNGLADETTDGVGMIAAERRRQVEQEGWSVEHDNGWIGGELGDAAMCYAEHADLLRRGRAGTSWSVTSWPWDLTWWKPSPDPIRNLVKAGALICAEIDRLQRAAAPAADREVGGE